MLPVAVVDPSSRLLIQQSRSRTAPRGLVGHRLSCHALRSSGEKQKFRFAKSCALSKALLRDVGTGERPRLQRDLGTKNHMLLRNHGTLTVGRSVASAFERMYHLERACSMQVATRTLGPIAYPVDQLAIDKNTELLSNPDRAELRSTQLVWPPLLRKLDRVNPGYRD